MIIVLLNIMTTTVMRKHLCIAMHSMASLFYKISGQDVLQKVKILSEAAILIDEVLSEDPDAIVTCRIKSIEDPPDLPGISSSLATRGPPSFV